MDSIVGSQFLVGLLARIDKVKKVITNDGFSKEKVEKANELVQDEIKAYLNGFYPDKTRRCYNVSVTLKTAVYASPILVVHVYDELNKSHVSFSLDLKSNTVDENA